MTIKTTTHLYDTYAEAVRAVTALEAAGVPHADISIVGNDHAAASRTAPAHDAAGTGASLGTVLGGGAGLLAGIGALAIPGVGPVVAAGWLVATLTGAGAGAAAGSLLGSLTGAGVHDDDAHVYAEGVRRGGTLVTVRADDSLTSRIVPILAETGPVVLADRRTSYQSENWNRFDETAPAYGPAETEAERQRLRRL